MADQQNVNPAGCLGRALTLAGYVWVGFAILGGVGMLREFGLDDLPVGNVLGSVIPGFILIGIGRSIARRVKPVEGPAPSSQPRPTQKRTPPVLRPAPPQAKPRPEPKPQPRPERPQPQPTRAEQEQRAARSLEEVLGVKEGDEIGPPAQRPPATGPMPRPTSQEMIEEARKKWGSKGG